MKVAVADNGRKAVAVGEAPAGALRILSLEILKGDKPGLFRIPSPSMTIPKRMKAIIKRRIYLFSTMLLWQT
jgi:hypothetical protein